MPERKLEIEFQLFLFLMFQLFFSYSLSVVFEFKKRWRNKENQNFPSPLCLSMTYHKTHFYVRQNWRWWTFLLLFSFCKLREQSQWWGKVIWSEIDFTLKLRHVLSFSMIGFTLARAQLVYNMGRRAVFAVNSTFNSCNFKLTWQAELSCATTSK